MVKQGTGSLDKVNSFGIWVLEILIEAVGTAAVLWLVGIAYGFDSGGPPDFGARVIPFVSLGVLFLFFNTGYVLTTGLAALYLPRRGRLVYPLVSASFYLLHSEVVFWHRNGPRLQNLGMQVGGVCVAFATTYWGDRKRGF